LLVRLSLRSASSLVLGFAAGELGLFVLFATPNQSLFFYLAIGMFPLLALGAFRKKAQELFSPGTVGCEPLPICLIDGIDDDVADALAESGIWEIEHVATTTPIDLLLRTPFPPNRILDWLDQAALISYVREKITFFRDCGIRGAIDLAVLYMDLQQPAAAGNPLPGRADQIIKALAQKSGIAEQSILAIGRSLYEDANVQMIWDLWQSGTN
jgi:hypothetical protein